MAKALPGLGINDDEDDQSRVTDKEDRQSKKRLTFDVTAEQHHAFKREAMDANLSMQDYFLRLWKAGKAKKK
jgi:hypothetical protein